VDLIFKQKLAVLAGIDRGDFNLFLKINYLDMPRDAVTVCQIEI
jgi:hypothetical protein